MSKNEESRGTTPCGGPPVPGSRRCREGYIDVVGTTFGKWPRDVGDPIYSLTKCFMKRLNREDRCCTGYREVKAIFSVLMGPGTHSYRPPTSVGSKVCPTGETILLERKGRVELL